MKNEKAEGRDNRSFFAKYVSSDFIEKFISNYLNFFIVDVYCSCCIDFVDFWQPRPCCWRQINIPIFSSWLCLVILEKQNIHKCQSHFSYLLHVFSNLNIVQYYLLKWIIILIFYSILRGFFSRKFLCKLEKKSCFL